MAELHPGAARKIRGRLEGARLLTIGLEGWVVRFEEGQGIEERVHLKKRRKHATQYRVRKETRRSVP